MKVILHSDDILLVNHWKKALNYECEIVDDVEALSSFEDSLILLSYSVCLTNNILTKLVLSNKVLILHRTANIDTAKYVLSLGAKGYGNAFMKEHFISSAVETIQDGMLWLYPEFTTMLIHDIPEKKQNDKRLEVLSKREKEVALLLKDGRIYKEIGDVLSITPRTVKAHASKIYLKLAVKDRLGLALLLK